MKLKKIRGKKRRQRNLEKFIPIGHYCYSWNDDGSVNTCPFYRNDKNNHFQENGICEAFKIRDSDDSYSLLWDMVKECNINED